MGEKVKFGEISIGEQFILTDHLGQKSIWIKKSGSIGTGNNAIMFSGRYNDIGFHSNNSGTLVFGARMGISRKTMVEKRW